MGAVEVQEVVRAAGFRWRRLVPLLLVALDVAAIYLAFVTAYWLRYSLKLGPHISVPLGFKQYQPLALLLVAAMVLVLFLKGAYRTRLSVEAVDELSILFSASTITVATTVVVTSMLHEFQYSRAVMVYLWVLLVVILAAGRMLFRSGQALCFRRGWGVRRLLVVGASEVARRVMQSVVGRRDLGYSLVGFVERRGTAEVRDFGRFRALGTVADIPDLIEAGSIDEVIIALPSALHEEIFSVLALCEQRGVGVKLIPDLFEISLSRVRVDNIAGIPVLQFEERSLRQVERTVKRTMDIAVAAFTLLVTLPLTAIIVLLIRLQSSGPAILGQQRVGMNGRPFRCYKFRTMRSDAEELRAELEPFNEVSGPLFKIRNDPRVTRIGRRIRRWSLDELPQMWNVLVGDMSLVGPRPPLPIEVERYEERHLQRLSVKPGLTGLWQVNGRANLPFEEMVMYDLHYIDAWSVMLDVKIMLRTILAVLGRQGAY